MNILIDCGFHRGENIGWFIEKCQGSDFKIYGFEPNSGLIFDHEFEFLTIYNKAVSTFNGKRKFYVMESDFSSSFYRKKRGRVKKEIEVECIDLCEWIKDNINEDDTVFLKLDVEGEEHMIVPKLLDAGLFGTYINEMYVEFHQWKLRDKV